MERKIIFDQDEQEGLMYDLERANDVGLFEHISLHANNVRGDQWEVNMTDELADALISAMDLGVNIAPGDPTSLRLQLDYVYDYGKPPEESGG